jgi:Uma2 family endonuclease
MRKRGTEATPLELFLKLPEFKPALEYLGGRVIQKMSPMLPHSVIQGELLAALNQFARPRKLGRAYPELRAVFGGSALVPDIAFYAPERLPKIVRGRASPPISLVPDLIVEIRSPGQSLVELRRKIRHAIRHGSSLGWLIDPGVEQVFVIRPGEKSQRLGVGKILDGQPVLPGFSLAIADLFGWLEED